MPWRELAAALATVLSGSLAERLRLVFDAFDERGKGELGLAEVTPTLTLDPTAHPNPNPNQPQP